MNAREVSQQVDFREEISRFFITKIQERKIYVTVAILKGKIAEQFMISVRLKGG